MDERAQHQVMMGEATELCARNCLLTFQDAG